VVSSPQRQIILSFQREFSAPVAFGGKLMKLRKRPHAKVPDVRTKRRKTLRTLLIIVAVPVVVFALILAATPFSQLARGFMFSVVIWQDADIAHIKVFPARDIPTSTASKLPRLLDDTTLKAFSTLDLRFYLVDQPSPEPISLRSRAELDQFMSDSDTTAFLVVKDGVLVHEWYAEDIDPDALHTSFSVSKSILSTVVGMAINDGSISSLDDPITAYVPELLEKDSRFANITLRHLITMTSGLKYEENKSPFGDPINTYYSTDLRRTAMNSVIVEEPSKNFLYNNYNPLLLGMAVERATGRKISDYMSKVLWAPMGAEDDASWSMDSFYNGFEKLESGFNARPIDFARFGLMFANGGKVDGVQVVPPDWVEEATAPTNVSVGQNDYLNQNYQYFWWVYPNNRFAAQGNLGQFVFISPDEATIIVRLGRSETLMWPMLLLELIEQLETGATTNG
jgi:CubicO group peptidase (beta-lactamase class C family)